MMSKAAALPRPSSRNQLIEDADRAEDDEAAGETGAEDATPTAKLLGRAVLQR